MPVTRELSVENKLSTSIHVFVAESKLWAIADKIAQVGEYAVAGLAFAGAAEAFVAAYIAAAPELAGAAPSAASALDSWAPERVQTVLNWARQIANNPAVRAQVKFDALVRTAEAMIEAVPKVTLEIASNSGPKKILEEGIWQQLFNPSAWIELGKVTTLLMMIFDKANNRMVMVNTTDQAQWRVDGTGAYNVTNGMMIDWDGLASSQEDPTFVANSNANGGLMLMWPNAQGTLNGAVLNSATWNRCWPAGEWIHSVRGLVGAAFHDGNLHVGFTEFYSGAMGQAMYSRGSLEALNSIGWLVSDADKGWSDITGVAFARSASGGLHGAYCYSDKTVIHVMYRKMDEDNNGYTGFGDWGRVYAAPDNNPKLMSLHCPALAWYARPNAAEQLHLAVESDEGVRTYVLEPVNSTTSYAGELIPGASAPSFLITANDLMIAYKLNGKFWIKSVYVAVQPTVLIDNAPTTRVSFGSDGKFYYAVYRDDQGGIHVMKADDTIQWSLPTQLPFYVDPSRPSG